MGTLRTWRPVPARSESADPDPAPTPFRVKPEPTCRRRPLRQVGRPMAPGCCSERVEGHRDLRDSAGRHAWRQPRRNGHPAVAHLVEDGALRRSRALVARRPTLLLRSPAPVHGVARVRHDDPQEGPLWHGTAPANCFLTWTAAGSLLFQERDTLFVHTLAEGGAPEAVAVEVGPWQP